jgi:hypothetical protein
LAADFAHDELETRVIIAPPRGKIETTLV